MLLQVIHVQCNVELIEEGTKFHVSVLSKNAQVSYLHCVGLL